MAGEPETLADVLGEPLTELRGYWVEARCCGAPERSPMWFHARRWPGWLLSDFADDHTCDRCGASPALALLRAGRAGTVTDGWRLEVCGRFENDAG